MLPTRNRIALYYGLIQSLLDYCCIVLGNTTANNIDKVYTLQKRALRVLFDLPFDFPSADLFSRFDVMSIRQRIFYFLAVTMYKCVTNNAPDYLCNVFVPQSHVNTYQTRSALNQNFYEPRCFLNVGTGSFQYRAI